MEHLKQAMESGPGLLPVFVGMVRLVRDKVAEMTPGRWFDQLVGSAVTGGIVVLVGYLMGIPTLKANLDAVAVQVLEVKTDIKDMKAAMTADKVDALKADNAMDRRVTVIEEQHKQIINGRGRP